MLQFWSNIVHIFLCGLIRPLHGAMIKGHEDPLVNVMRWRFARKDQRIRPSINRKPMSTSSNIFCLGLRRTFQPLAEYSSAKSFEKLSFSLDWFDILLARDGRMISRWGLRICSYMQTSRVVWVQDGYMIISMKYEYTGICWLHECFSIFWGGLVDT